MADEPPSSPPRGSADRKPRRGLLRVLKKSKSPKSGTAPAPTSTASAASSAPVSIASASTGAASSSAAAAAAAAAASSELGTSPPREMGDQKRLGHRKIDKETGEVAYKKVKSSALMQAIQLGVRQSVGAVAQRANRDLLLQDFDEVESLSYPKEGSPSTPAHHFDSFKFISYAPVAFRQFREKFEIETSTFLMSLCDKPLRELSNPGASGSVFYLSHDDTFIIKTVQKGEHQFLRKLLPGYYMNLVQNKRTLLPKFFGLFCYQSILGKNIRFVIMNNLLPSHLTYFEKYDLKGSTFKRFASDRERQKKHPTYKDLDFNEFHPGGLRMQPEQYEKLMHTIRRDCMVLESFKIMDYSLLVGLHNTAEDQDITYSEIADPETGALKPRAPGPCKYRDGRKAITLLGFSGDKHILNGSYDIMAANFNDLAAYSRVVPDTNPAATLYLFYDARQSKWVVSHTLGHTDSALAYLSSDVPSPEVSTAAWFVRDESGQYSLDRNVHVQAIHELRSEASASEKRMRRSSMSFGTLSEQIDEDDVSRPVTPGQATSETPHGGLIAYNAKGEKIIVFLGIIDILQNYAVRKKLEHTYKAIVHDGDSVSVCRPSFYSKRFQNYFNDRVFRPFKEERKEEPREIVASRTSASKAPLPRARYGSMTRPQPTASPTPAAMRESSPSPKVQRGRSPSAVRRQLANPLPVDEDSEEEDGDAIQNTSAFSAVVPSIEVKNATPDNIAPGGRRLINVSSIEEEMPEEAATAVGADDVDFEVASAASSYLAMAEVAGGDEDSIFV